jgi:6-phosphogluconolactonase
VTLGEQPLVVRHRDGDLLAAGVAARLVTAVLDAVAARGEASVVLTGGSMGSAVLEAVREVAAAGGVDWSLVSWWWGDERFLPAGDPDRNDTQNRRAFLDHVGVDPSRVHAVPGPGSPHGESAETAAAEYARQLAAAGDADPAAGLAAGPATRAGAADAPVSPVFDVVLLGVGPDGHVASLFPGHPVLDVEHVAASAVHDSPKPPPTRVTLTFPVLCRAREVWFVVSGTDKAEAVARGVSGDDAHRTPAARVHGLERTLWLVDEDAAAAL